MSSGFNNINIILYLIEFALFTLIFLLMFTIGGSTGVQRIELYKE